MAEHAREEMKFIIRIVVFILFAASIGGAAVIWSRPGRPRVAITKATIQRLEIAMSAFGERNPGEFMKCFSKDSNGSLIEDRDLLFSKIKDYIVATQAETFTDDWGSPLRIAVDNQEFKNRNSLIIDGHKVFFYSIGPNKRDEIGSGDDIGMDQE